MSPWSRVVVTHMQRDRWILWFAVTNGGMLNTQPEVAAVRVGRGIDEVAF